MKRILGVLSLVFVVAACSDSDTSMGPDEITLADLVGSWTASSHVYANNANPGEAFDLIAAGGETRTTVLHNGGARTWITFGTFSDEWDAQLSISGNTLTSDPVEASRQVRTWALSLAGNLLTLTDATSSFDFTLAGGDGVSATEVVVFARQ